MMKKPKEIQYIREGGAILASIVRHLETLVIPGATTEQIDRVAEQMIRKAGGRPSFKGYTTAPEQIPFASTICACINEEIVHAPAIPGRVLNAGDIFSIDMGMEWPLLSKSSIVFLDGRKEGYYTDMAITIPVGTISSEAQRLLDRTKESLMAGINVAVVGNSIADIGRAIESTVKPFGYGIVRDLVGHGVGYAVHEDPYVPNYYAAENEKIILQEGMVLALEPMITMGSHRVRFMNDGWTVQTEDHSLNAHFEHTIVVTTRGPEILTL